MKNKNDFMICGVILLLSMLPGIGSSAPRDQDQPVIIEADNAQMDDQHGLSVYSGNVIITQGTLRITADSVTAHKENNGMNKIVAEGKPAHYTQADNSKGGIVNASANTIHYLTDKDKIVLMGNATLEQQGNTVQGENITYDMKRKIGNANSNGSSTKQENGRVKMVFQPKSSSTSTPKTEANKP